MELEITIPVTVVVGIAIASFAVGFCAMYLICTSRETVNSVYILDDDDEFGEYAIEEKIAWIAKRKPFIAANQDEKVKAYKEGRLDGEESVYKDLLEYWNSVRSAEGSVCKDLLEHLNNTR